jgi:transcriptional regulator with XRE-family HTH domain
MPRTLAHHHRGDMTTRNRLIDELASRRTTLGMSQRELAETLRVTRNSVMTLEKQRPANPRVDTLLTYAQPLHLALRIGVDGLPDVACPMADLLYAGGFLGQSVTARLRAIREHIGVSRKRLEAEHAWNRSALAAFENTMSPPMLAQLQRYARALGGRLDARWEAL